MGRLVRPLTKEEYDKLSARGKWAADHPITMTIIATMPVVLLIVAVIIAQYWR